MLSELNLKKIRLVEQKKLSNTNLCLYKNITSYIKNSILTENEKEEVLQQIMDMMLQAELEHKSINLFIGKDYEEFCDAIIKEFNNSRNITYKILNYIQKYLIWNILIIGFISLGSLLKTGALSISLEQLILASGFSLSVLPFIEAKRKEALYVPLHEKFKFKININNSIMVIPMAVILGFIFITRFIIGGTLGIEVLSYSLGIYKNIGSVLCVIAIIIIIEVYRLVYNKIQLK